ncbi:hypothetical protein L6452_10553 [Arctium lappa]|uniref:Uncharacterized protein n=1 Tax=Arctium lappa TaxID=4217 RepID=A0ACB9DMU5_ARCLA|nr:hypothetical protein L6452_10553 [Arctium lappa]
MAREVQRQRSGPEEDSSFSSFLEDQPLVQEELGIDSSEENVSQSFGSEDDGVSETEWGEESQFGEEEDRSVNGGKREDQRNVVGPEGSTGNLGGASAADRKNDQTLGGVNGFDSRKESGGCGFYEEATTLIEEESNLNGNSEATYNKLGKGNMENIEKDNQAHQANGGGIYCGLGGEYVGAQQVGLDGKVVEIHKAGAESEGFNNGTDGLQKLKAGKGSAGLGEGMKSKENKD